ncbi:MAG: hypothetical protein A2511_10105 [Deltaproteobacteria bacterium RIFOXYD12_FULL_50_9]|nr:MAG: hypothetical protein A2511_10105 [Deltaproteobacteria bacterium RIFOXYD12_FULL_50_9]
MAPERCPKSAQASLELYFLENRARLLEIAAFLDRIDRCDGAADARADFRYNTFIKALHLLFESGPQRTKAIQLSFSDPTLEPIASAEGLRAHGAWEGGLK